MLKWVPDWAHEWVGWLYRLRSSCNRLPETCCFWLRVGDATPTGETCLPRFS